jgi:hypothetical protein
MAMRAASLSDRSLFGALIAAQTVHSVEEYAGRLWETFPPVRFVSGLVSDNLEAGFVIANVVLIAFGVWCALVPVRRRWPAAIPLMSIWAVLAFGNGVGHAIWSVMRGGYTPGVATAPIMALIAVLLLRRIVAGTTPTPT